MVYQRFEIDVDGRVRVFDSTLEKVQISLRALDLAQPGASVLDVGCAEGAMGAAIAQARPSSSVRVVNGSPHEAEGVRALVAAAAGGNIAFEHAWVTAKTAPADVTLWFAVLHHILSGTSPEDAVNMVADVTAKIAVVEVPIHGDALLSNWMQKTAAGTYDVLRDRDTARAWLETRFDVVAQEDMTYAGTAGDLVRVAFTCRRR